MEFGFFSLSSEEPLRFPGRVMMTADLLLEDSNGSKWKKLDYRARNLDRDRHNIPTENCENLY